MKPIIAITAGDINGVGYEVLLKTICDPHICEICRPIVYGNAKIARQHAHQMGEEYTKLQFNLIDSPKQAKDGRLNLITCYPDDTPLQLGFSTPEAGRAAFAALERACADLKAEAVDALVTAPINKENIQSPDFRFSGHTEYLTSVFGEGHDSLMMMLSDVMRVALVCNHLPISAVPAAITKERILQKISVLNKALQTDFSLEKPRIAVLALNPHAGDNGLIGKEESEVIAPAIAEAREQGIWAFGPYAADGFFGSGKFAHFDAVLAMYHDQGLAPFKTLDMDGVNYTAGLPIVRTSPDHGTAYDLAGKNQADHLSFAHALYAAIDILRTRRQNTELQKNPLPFIPREDNEERRPRREFTDFKTTRPTAETATQADKE